MTPGFPYGEPVPPPAAPELVARALADVGRIGMYFAIAVGGDDEAPRPAGDDQSPRPARDDEAPHPAGDDQASRPAAGDDGKWRPAGEGYAAGLGPLVESHAAYLGVEERRVAASIAQLGHAARLWSPVLACALLHGIVPDLRGLRRRPRGTELMLPEPAGFLAPEGEELARLVYAVVVRDHLQPLAAGLTVKLATGLLHGNTASALAGSAKLLVRARPGVREPLTHLTEALLDIGDLRGSGRLTGPGFEFRRNSCCLYYRVPGGGLCGDCSLA